MKIYYHPQFRDAYQKLSLNAKKITETKERIFKENPFDRRLKTHKLHGKLKNLWSFSVGNKFRIVFAFDGSEVIFLDIGDHKVYH